MWHTCVNLSVSLQSILLLKLSSTLVTDDGFLTSWNRKMTRKTFIPHHSSSTAHEGCEDVSGIPHDLINDSHL